MIKLRESIAKRLNRAQEVEAATYPLREMAERLFGLTDLQYGAYAFLHEPLERKFSKEEKQTYIVRTNTCGAEEARLMKLQAGTDAPAPEQIAGLLGLNITEQDTPAGGGHVIFAQYTEPDQITLFSDCVTRFGNLAAEEHLEDLFGEWVSVPSLIRSILLYHEMFHAIEFQKKETIYTQTEKVELWKKPFSNQSGILALSEMAAMAFAKELAGIPFSPYALDVLLIYSYSEKAACALYEEILEAAGELRNLHDDLRLSQLTDDR